MTWSEMVGRQPRPHGKVGPWTWTTCDDGMSYMPTLSFGDTIIFYGSGQNWGASGPRRVRVSLLCMKHQKADRNQDVDWDTEEVDWVDISPTEYGLLNACKTLAITHREHFGVGTSIDMRELDRAVHDWWVGIPEAMRER